VQPLVAKCVGVEDAANADAANPSGHQKPDDIAHAANPSNLQAHHHVQKPDDIAHAANPSNLQAHHHVQKPDDIAHAANPSNLQAHHHVQKHSSDMQPLHVQNDAAKPSNLQPLHHVQIGVDT
jgi:hypothetical protein